MTRAERLVVLVGAAMVVVASVAWAGPREDALTRIRDQADAAARRQAVEQLADVGVMADVPVLVTALRDPDPHVRALAERALWEVWSRSGDAEADQLLALG